ncbi:dsRBD fold-containing protein [Streptosporangium sp. NPDC000396]|uniref:dsRBD fold-containing protein n=1 Tax=Streptosporangium sp. NPDC000396 TaxID=3366185 RepID=UPI003680753A
MKTKRWDVRIFISEDDSDDVTTARAVLMTPGGRKHQSVAHARRNPDDRPVPAIGDELAAGRALSDLAGKLMKDGAADAARLAEHEPMAW